MTQNKQDILTMRKDLKERPYGVPQGYFDSFKAEMTGKVVTRRTGQWKMLIPYIAIAASFALLIAGGSLMMRGAAETQMSQEDYILFSDNMISAYYEDEEFEQIAEAEMRDEDIIEYLIYIGVSPETIELSK